MSDLFRELELPREWHAELFRHATERGLDFLSTPFDHEAVDLLDDLGVKAFKIASYELWHLPLIRDVASRGKPIICSTGMADLADGPGRGRRRARDRQRRADPAPLRRELPAAIRGPQPPGDRTMREAFGVPVGYSDHSPAGSAPIVATALGAAVIEKHFTLDRAARSGPPLRARARRADRDGPRDP